MDDLHVQGVNFIQHIQLYFKNESSFMVLISHLSDPKNAFLFYFPLIFCLHKSVGKRILWVAAISEWLNAVFKWILHGERPYWWVSETHLYKTPPHLDQFDITCETGPGSPSGHCMVTSTGWILHGERPYWWVSETHLYKTPPHLDQFDITCETGPGSPSGHCMVTSAVIYIIISDFIYYQKIKSSAVRACCWSSYIVLLMLVCLSRCYIAAHFPHQVISGTLVGVLIGMVMNKISTTNLKLMHYMSACGVMLIGGIGTFYLIQSFGFDPFWSISKAQRRCANPEWVHLDSTLFFSIIRDISTLLGLGIGSAIKDFSKMQLSPFITVIQIVASLALTLGSDWIQPAKDPVIVFYLLGSLKLVFIFVIVVTIIPRLSNARSGKTKKKKKIN